MRQFLFTNFLLLCFSSLLYCQDFFEGTKRKDLEFKFKSRVLKTSVKKIDSFNVAELPNSLKNCTIEQFVEILKDARKQGKIKF